QSAALIHASERERLVRVACLSGTIAQELQQTRRQAGQRQQGESVVLENCAKRTRIAGPEELKVARGNLEPRYIADAVRAKDLLLEGNERARSLSRIRREGRLLTSAKVPAIRRPASAEATRRKANRCRLPEQTRRV